MSTTAEGPATFTTAHMSVSLDGFVAGPDQSADDPLGRGGLAVHHWHIGPEESRHEIDKRWTERLLRPRGAYVMGRNMYGPVRGPWSNQPDWRGWWGDEPPYHAPVFVLTHHAHEPIEMSGGTTSSSSPAGSRKPSGWLGRRVVGMSTSPAERQRSAR